MMSVALIAGLMAVLLASQWLDAKSGSGMTKVAVASTDISLGQRLTPELVEMVDWPNAWHIENETHDAWAVDERQVAESVDGIISWSAFEEAIYDWLDITTLTPEIWAPSLNKKQDWLDIPAFTNLFWVERD